ncbi:MAG: peptidylprolyl isomerase [Gammaproteobacteria bacterium]|nr:peptidylprolyl isomerase [Gammaproteobacteria bacterium]
MDLDAGRVIFELSPVFAPQHVANLRALIRTGWFEGLSINRVQDNFVTQWGDPDGKKIIVGAAARVPPEFEREWTADIKFDSLADGDVFAPQAGFVDGFWAAGDREAGRIWLTHCYGTLGVGRDTAADSGSGAELYVVIGHAPRQLDRNITVLGRAVSGMELLSALPRGTQALGFYATAAERTPIRRVIFAADLPATERVELELLRTDSASFAALVEARRNRRDDWYKVPLPRWAKSARGSASRRTPARPCAISDSKPSSSASALDHLRAAFVTSKPVRCSWRCRKIKVASATACRFIMYTGPTCMLRCWLPCRHSIRNAS